jgi:CheY-like chemotaxis protein/anti-sigma regulatory factor (Ser/Thr protein kinase)
MGAEGEIRDALTNLVLNAVDAMPEGGTLTLQTRPVRDSSRSGDSETVTGARVEIGDTGVGMDEETKRRCLEPFFTTKGERGTGLGLATVYGMVQRHSAEIEIDSRPGKGTTMRVIFPVTSSTVTPAERPSAAPVKPLHRLRLLVVDDDPLLIKSLRDALEGDGHLITVADGGQSGIDAFAASVSRGEPFTAVITDLGMPSVDGRRVAAAVKAASPGTPVILLTGWGQRLVAENDIPPHVDRVLNKPPRLRELREALAHCCSGAGADQKPKI